MGEISNLGSEPRSDIICLEGNGARPSHKGNGWSVGVRCTLNSAEVPGVLVFDARGNGNGGVAPTITGDHQNRITDYTAIVLEHDIQKTETSEIEG